LAFVHISRLDNLGHAVVAPSLAYHKGRNDANGFAALLEATVGTRCHKTDTTGPVHQCHAAVGHQVPQSAGILEVAFVYLRAAGTVNGYLFIPTIHSLQFIIQYYKEKAAFI
jgi:hypothetical protein